VEYPATGPRNTATISPHKAGDEQQRRSCDTPPPRTLRAVRAGTVGAQHGVDPLLQPVVQDVLQQLSLGVDLVPRHVQHPHEERLQQPVPADDPDRDPLALRGKPQPGTLGPFQQVLALETLRHRGRRGRRHAQLMSEHSGGDRFTRGSQTVDRF